MLWASGWSLDTEAIAATREDQRHALSGSSARVDEQQAIRTEMRNAFFCQSVLAVNAREAELIRALGLPDVRVLGHLRPLALTPSPWAQRAGMLFVGAMHGTESPNYNSLCWFVDEVLPLIEQQLGYETRLTIVGFANDVDLGQFHNHARITLRGSIADTVPLYNAHRVFVAPTRYAAGLPYKKFMKRHHMVYRWRRPRCCGDNLSGSADEICSLPILSIRRHSPENVLALYRSEALWNDIRSGAAERIRTECGRETFERMVAEILQ